MSESESKLPSLPSGSTVADLLMTRLVELGVGRLYGHVEEVGTDACERAGIRAVPVDDPDLACLLADADGRIGHRDGTGRLGAAVVGGPVLHLSSCPGGMAPLQTAGSPEDLVDVLASVPGVDVPAATAIHLDLDLEAVLEVAVMPAVEPERSLVFTLDPSMASLNLVAVVGPGVVRAGGVEGLKAFARSAGIGIVNSWGAKGVERWDSPFNFGTAGLQARDMELAGVPSTDIVVASGLDSAELSVASLGNPVVQEVAPGQLAALCHRWAGSQPAPEVRPALYRDLADLVTPLYESDAVPLSPARAALHLSGALPDGGVAVADPGPAGLWLARTFPTSFPGSVCVPATSIAGFAAAAALVCALEQRPCLAVSGAGAEGWGSDGSPDPTTDALMELARGLGVGLALQVWGTEGSLRSFDDHVSLLKDHLRVAEGATEVRLDPVPVDLSVTASLVEIAGPVVAWGGERV